MTKTVHLHCPALRLLESRLITFAWEYILDKSMERFYDVLLEAWMIMLGDSRLRTRFLSVRGLRHES